MCSSPSKPRTPACATTSAASWVYAAFGIPDVWVVDALTLVTHVHRQLGPNGYAERFEAGSAETLTAVRAPSVSMCLERLGLMPL